MVEIKTGWFVMFDYEVESERKIYGIFHDKFDAELYSSTVDFNFESVIAVEKDYIEKDGVISILDNSVINIDETYHKFEMDVEIETKNFNKHSESLYTAKNQNGFNNSLYDYYRDHDKESVRRAVQNYPKKYPATFIIINQMFECNRIYIEEIDINELKQDF